MQSYFAKLDNQGWRLLVGDDNAALLVALRGMGFQELKSEEAISAYNESSQAVVVFLLDSNIRTGPRTNPTVIEWIAAVGIRNQPKHGKYLVLYSGETFSHKAFHRSYEKAGERANDLKEDVERIILLLKEGKPLDEWPPKLAQPVDELSRVIHGLQNLFLPVKLDAETLEGLSKSPKRTTIGKEIFADHFAPSPTAYLTKKTSVLKSDDIMSRVGSLIDSLEPDVSSAVEGQMTALTKAVDSARKNYENSALDSTPPSKTNELQTQLQAIADACDALVRVLRELRKKKLGGII